MVIQFTPLTKDNTVQDMSVAINNIGSELTKSNNIFLQVDSLTKAMQNVQQYSLTTKNGYSSVPSSLKYIRDLREAGYYYISASTLATLGDAPDVGSSDVVVTVIPSSSRENCIQYLHTLRASINPRALFRYATTSMSTDWLYINTSSLGMNTNLTNKDLATDDIEMGTYYFYNLQNTPKDVSKGFIEVKKGQNDLVVYEITDGVKGLMYKAVKTPDSGLSSWSKEVTPTSVTEYTLGTLTEGAEAPDYDLIMHKGDELDFYAGVRDYIIKSGKNTFTFYLQGGVTNSPTSNSNRGIFISSSIPSKLVDGSTKLNGNYYAIGTDGRHVSGAVSEDSWSTPKSSVSGGVLWTGNKLFTDTSKTEKLLAPIDNYDYFEVYVKPRTTTNSKGDIWDVVNNIGHKYYKGTDDFFIVSGTIVDSQATNIGVDHYRVDLRITGDTFKISGSAALNKKAHYVTRIVGYKVWG